MNMTKTSEKIESDFEAHSAPQTKIVVAAAPVLDAAKKSHGGSFECQIHLPSGVLYELETSGDLQNWTLLESGITAVDSVRYVDVDAAKFRCRFYRAVCQEMVSENIIGYATVNLPPGFSMIANPFNAPSNTISALLPAMPTGTTLCKFDTNLFRLTNNTVKNGQWSNPGEKLVPGEGAIFFNPTPHARSVDFVGEVSQGYLLNPIPAGLSIRSSLVPQAGSLNPDLGFPIAPGDVIHLFDREQQQYKLYPFSTEAWKSNPPRIGVGESFWIAKTQPGNWVKNFPEN